MILKTQIKGSNIEAGHSINSSSIADKQQTATYNQETDFFAMAMLSNKGGRTENQDAFGFAIAHDGSYCFSVADGLGGHSGGKRASSVVIDAVNAFVTQKHTKPAFNFHDATTLCQCFCFAQSTLLKAQTTENLPDMRTTLAVLWIKDGLALWGHSGDVRIYHFHHNIYLRTKDDSVPQLLYEAGEIKEQEIRSHAARSRLLRSLGSKDDFNPNIAMSYTQLYKGDVLQLSSDGFWEWIDEKETIRMFDDVEKSTSKATEKMCQVIVNKAQKKEKEYDNYTVANIYIKQTNINFDYLEKTKKYKSYQPVI